MTIVQNAIALKGPINYTMHECHASPSWFASLLEFSTPVTVKQELSEQRFNCCLWAICIKEVINNVYLSLFSVCLCVFAPLQDRQVHFGCPEISVSSSLDPAFPAFPKSISIWGKSSCSGLSESHKATVSFCNVLVGSYCKSSLQPEPYFHSFSITLMILSETYWFAVMLQLFFTVWHFTRKMCRQTSRIQNSHDSLHFRREREREREKNM